MPGESKSIHSKKHLVMGQPHSVSAIVPAWRSADPGLKFGDDTEKEFLFSISEDSWKNLETWSMAKLLYMK